MSKDPDGKGSGFLCIDWNDEKPISLYGREQDEDYQRLEAIITPCNYLHKSLVNDTIHPECEYDPEKQFDYLGPIQMVVLHNTERFNP